MRVLVAALLLLGGLAAAHQGKGSRPQSLGLPDELPADLVERDGYDLFDVDVPRGHVGVEMDRLHPESCRLCHAVHSPQAYQYRDKEHVGPCGFGPANPSMLTQWAPAYQVRHGYWPFAS